MEAGRQRRREGREERQRSAGRDHPVACRLVWSSPTPTILLCSLPFPAPHLPLPLTNPYRSFSLLRLLVLQVGRYDFDIVVSLLTVSSSPRWFLVSPSDNSLFCPSSLRSPVVSHLRRRGVRHVRITPSTTTRSLIIRTPVCRDAVFPGSVESSKPAIFCLLRSQKLSSIHLFGVKKKKRFELTRDYTFSTNYFLVYYTRERNGREWASNPLCH